MKRGIAVPRDLSVVGFDDIGAAAAVTPSMTTVRQPLLEKGRIVGRLILGQEAPPPGDALLLPTELAAPSLAALRHRTPLTWRVPPRPGGQRAAR